MNLHSPKDPEMCRKMAQDSKIASLSRELFLESCRYKYSYNLSWLGLPIIQYPEDMVALQEVIWEVKPDLIIETGIAHGGSIIFYASMLELIGGNGLVVGIDVDIRFHNRQNIEKHSMYKRINMIEGSSIDNMVVNRVIELTKERQRIMIVLDSNHTHDHVLRELELYSPLVTNGSYLIVLDTIIEDLPDGFFSDRPWGKGNNPKTAVMEFLKINTRFIVDKDIENKLLLSVSPDGYLKCIKD